MGKPPSIDIFIREKGDEVVQLNLLLLTCVKLLVSADEPEKWVSEKVKQWEESLQSLIFTNTTVLPLPRPHQEKMFLISK